jgi:hypothetical protein
VWAPRLEGRYSPDTLRPGIAPGRWFADDDAFRCLFDSTCVCSLQTIVSSIRSGGDEGTRTPDIRLAKAALSQLSYIPVLAVSFLLSAISRARLQGMCRHRPTSDSC